MAQDKGHSPVGASSRYRWSRCPGSVNSCKKLPPQRASSYAEEGTLAHTFAAFYLENQRWPQECSAEMIEHLSVYTNAVFNDKATLDQKVNGNLFLVEHGFALEMIHKDAWGTADCVIYDAKRKLLYVYDLKYGAGIFVDAVDNEQLIYYAVGAFLSLDLPAKEVILKIAQPRCEHPDGLVREHRFTTDKLLDAASDIETEIKATDDPKAPLNPGEWCRFCPAAGVPCPALAKNASMVAKKIFAPTQDYDPQLLSETLDKLPMLEAFISQVREFAYGEALHGRVPPNYKLVAKRATRKWKDEAEATKFFSKNSACFTEPELKSPAQIEKIIKDGKKLVEPLTVKESSGHKLAHISEKGEPVLLDVKNIFTEIKDEIETILY